VTSRSYPLEIEPFADHGEELLGVYSKGHHAGASELTGDPFLQAARKHLDEEECWDAEELADLDQCVVQFETWRCIPCRLDGDWWTMFRPATPGQPGAFPVTVLRFDGP
jgi:hypothetical protein